MLKSVCVCVSMDTLHLKNEGLQGTRADAGENIQTSAWAGPAPDMEVRCSVCGSWSPCHTPTRRPV